jgi:hypothetical protein
MAVNGKFYAAAAFTPRKMLPLKKQLFCNEKKNPNALAGNQLESSILVDSAVGLCEATKASNNY